MKKYKYLLLRLVPLVVLLVLIIGLSEMFYQDMIRSGEDQCWEELSMARSEAGREISIRLNNSITVLDMAADAIVLNADLEHEEAVLTYLAAVQERSVFDRIDMIYPDGRILIQSGEWAEDNGDKTYQELLNKGSHVSQRVADHHTGRQSIHVFSPVYNAEGENIAILGATIHCSTMAEIFISAHYGADAQMFLIDLRDGSVVLDKLHPALGTVYEMDAQPRPEEYEGVDFAADCMAGNTGKVAFLSGNDGGVSYLSYAPVENTSFAVGLMVHEDTIFAYLINLKKILNMLGIVEAVVLLVFSAWLYFVSRRSMQNKTRAQRAELALLQQQDEQLRRQYEEAANRQAFLEDLAVSLPGGYHRCTTDHDFKLTFISNSFTQVTGYTMEQLQEELNGSYMGIVAPEDRAYFLSMAPQLEQDGHIQCFYRIRRRNGSIRWVKDNTQLIQRDGMQYYQCALMDISEEIEQIERAREHAEASNHAKSTFLFNISHDIRTPMNAIKGFSRIIAENPDNPTLVRETIGKIHQASDSLMMLMNDVLDISRIERGKEDVNLQPMDLYEHGKNLYEMFVGDMQEAGIRFIASGDELHDHVLCDELKLTRIMMNMLSNAMKFTPAGGSVCFGGTRVHRDEKSCTYRFFVRDTGIGMSQEFQQRAFHQFERERTSTQSGVPGTGLGLAIIKMMVELMGGTVEIRSELGKGTEISALLTFPLVAGEMTPQAAVQKQNTPDLTGKRVLLVEDNEFNREIARYVLEGLQLDVDEAENGAVCIEKLLAAEPDFYDLILMDIQMPVMDGYTATLEIRNLEDGQRAGIPIIAMTANAFEEDRKRCMEVGMNGHVGKPIDVNELVQAMSAILTS